MSTILVTGGTGLVGSALARRLVADGHAVRILRRPASSLDLLGEAAERVEHAVGDVLDPDTLQPALDGVTHVYHTAARVGVGGPAEVERMHDVNVVGTANVLDAARRAGVRRVVHTSSIAALGAAPGDAPLDEDAAWDPARRHTAYARSKHDAEMEAHRAIAEGLDVVLVNPSLVFGIGRPGDNTRRIVDRVRTGGMPFVPSGSTNAVDVLDVVDGHLRAMERGQTGRRYLLVGENLSWMALAATLAWAFGAPPPRFTLGPRALSLAGAAAEAWARLARTEPALTRESARLASRERRYTAARAQAELGWRARPFEETARRLADAIGRD